jgi:hypothetical protein
VSTVDYTREVSVIEGQPPLREIDEAISRPLETKPDKKFYMAIRLL